jgi:hypothetical protein
VPKVCPHLSVTLCIYVPIACEYPLLTFGKVDVLFMQLGRHAFLLQVLERSRQRISRKGPYLWLDKWTTRQSMTFGHKINTSVGTPTALASYVSVWHFYAPKNQRSPWKGLAWRHVGECDNSTQWRKARRLVLGGNHIHCRLFTIYRLISERALLFARPRMSVNCLVRVWAARVFVVIFCKELEIRV